MKESKDRNKQMLISSYRLETAQSASASTSSAVSIPWSSTTAC